MSEEEEPQPPPSAEALVAVSLAQEEEEKSATPPQLPMTTSTTNKEEKKNENNSSRQQATSSSSSSDENSSDNGVSITSSNNEVHLLEVTKKESPPPSSKKTLQPISTGSSNNSRELEKIMEAHSLLAGFGSGDGTSQQQQQQRHSFGCSKDGQQPNLTQRKEELLLHKNNITNNDDIFVNRMSQSLRPEILQRDMGSSRFLHNDDSDNNNSSFSSQAISTTAAASAAKQLSKQQQQQEERDRAIREILGEYSSSSSSDDDEEYEVGIQGKKGDKTTKENQHEEEKEELQEEQQKQLPPPSNTSRYNNNNNYSSSFAARLARKQREMDTSGSPTHSSLSPVNPRRSTPSAQHVQQPCPRRLPPRLPSHASSKTSEAASCASSIEEDDSDSIVSYNSGDGDGGGVISSTTTNPTTLLSSSTTTPSQTQQQLTPFQRQMQQQLSIRTSHTSSAGARTISQSSLPGAYPTAGIAPFANPQRETFSDIMDEEVGNNNNDDNNNNNNNNTLVGEEIVAICVDDLVDEEANKICRDDIRDEIIRSAAQADVVNIESSSSTKNNNEKMLAKQLRFVTCGLLLVVVAVLAVGTAMGILMSDNDDNEQLDNNNNDDEMMIGAIVPSQAPSVSPTSTPIPTLQKVRQEGVLRCGIYETTGFDEESGERFGSDVDWCRAIAAAVHGRDSYEIILVDVTFADRFHLIANGTIDVLAAASTYTMDRNVYESDVETGLTFSPPFMYDGMRFAGVPEFVECADNDMKNFFECRDIMVCVVGGTSYQVILGSRLPKRQIIIVSGWQELYGSIRDGLCNVIAAEGVSLGEKNVRAFGYRGNYTVGHSLYSKIPLSIVTRNDDPQWSDFIATVVQSTFVAEREGITRDSSHLVSDAFISGSSLFGDDYENMFEDVIATIGNFGEFYERNAETAVTREGLNLLNNGISGLHFSHPFGFIQNEGPGPVPGGTLERIIQRGKLRCAVRPGRPGFAEATQALGGGPLNHSNHTYTGFDVDFCRALATSIFSGSVDLVEFVEVANDETEFAALAEGEVDVLSGGRWTLQNDIKDPFTGQGFSFSQPYFYGPDLPADIAGVKQRMDDNLCMVTRQDDHQWSAYVYWLVASTIYAEEKGIDQRLSNKMPEVHIFGPGFLRMFRDPILEFGNIGELYARNVQTFIPRSGRNMVNTIRAPGPQFYPIPGMLK